MNKDRKIGKSFPLGATVSPGGVNFSVFAKGGQACICYYSIRWTTPVHRERSRSIPIGIRVIIIGTFSCLGLELDRFTVTE